MQRTLSLTKSSSTCNNSSAGGGRGLKSKCTPADVFNVWNKKSFRNLHTRNLSKSLLKTIRSVTRRKILQTEAERLSSDPVTRRNTLKPKQTERRKQTSTRDRIYSSWIGDFEKGPATGAKKTPPQLLQDGDGTEPARRWGGLPARAQCITV